MIAEVRKKRKQLLLRVPTFKQYYYFTLVGDNGEPVAQSEQYTQKHNVTEVLRKYFPSFDVKDLTGES